MAKTGDFIRERMEEKGWKQADFAFVLGTTTATVNQIINGKRGISSNMARALGEALNIDPAVIARLQAEEDISEAKEPEPAIGVKAKVFSTYPLREMLRRGWIENSEDPEKLERRVCAFFEAHSLEAVPHLSHAAKRTSVEDIPPPQLAWLFRVKQIAKEMPTPRYSAKRLEEALETMKGFLGNREEVRYVPKLLNDAGIRFVIVEGLPGSKIDGVCFWLDRQSPVIGMSLRYDRIDNFWFVLRHECAHVLHGHGKDIAIIDSELEREGRDETEEEHIANSEAADFCVPNDRMESFYLRKHPMFSEKDILGFSKLLNVHPGLVVGQIHKRLGRYNFLRHYLEPVRDQIEGSAMIDGYGHYVPVS